MTRSFTLLVNPASGGGAAVGAVVRAARLLRDAGAEVEVTYSPGPRAAHRLVDGAVGRGDVVVSVGGDGMLSSLVGPVAARAGTLGLLPAGRGNDFARALGLPHDPAEQAGVLLAGTVREVDLVEATFPGGPSRVVAGSVYAGVDALASAIVDRAHRLPGALQYPYAAVRALASYQPGRYRLAVDGAEREVSAATVVVAGSGYYGKGMHIAPGAELDDGLLDVVVVEAASKRALIRSLPRLYDGSHVGLDGVTVLRGARVELRGRARGGVPVGGDGEGLGVLPALDEEPLVTRVLPGALRVLVPAAGLSRPAAPGPGAAPPR